jgi:hypothetical protein
LSLAPMHYLHLQYNRCCNICQVDGVQLEERRSGFRIPVTCTAIRSPRRGCPQTPARALRRCRGRIVQRQMSPADIRDYCELDAAGQSLIKAAMHRLLMHVRGHLAAQSSVCVLRGRDEFCTLGGCHSQSERQVLSRGIAAMTCAE